MTVQTETRRIERAVIFAIADERYAVAIECVQEVQRIVAFSGAAARSEIVVGMVNVRGTAIPVLDMRAMLGLPRSAYTVETPMLICRTPKGAVALIVDSVEDVVTLPSECPEPPPLLHALASRITGTARYGGEAVYLLDAEALLTDAASQEVA